jgi:hypothetical protein
MAIQNNTTGASIYDLGNVLKADSIAEVSHILKDAETKQTQQKQAEMQQAQQMQEQALQAKAEEARQKMEFEASENAKDRQARIVEAQIKSAGYGAMQDINENKQSDYMDAMGMIQQSDEFQQTTNLQREEMNLKGGQHRDKMALEQEKLNTQKEIADKQLQIAIQNKNKYDISAKEKKKNKEK